MALLSVIRRWYHRDQLSIREIARRTGLSRNTIRKYLRAGTAEPRFKVPERPSRLDPFAERLALWLRREMARSRKQKRTVRQLHADLVSLGYDGSYNRIAAFARDWREDYRRQQHMSGRGTFVPLSFAPGEAFQFDWSEDWAIIGGVRTKLPSKFQRSDRRPPLIWSCHLRVPSCPAQLESDRQTDHQARGEQALCPPWLSGRASRARG